MTFLRSDEPPRHRVSTARLRDVREAAEDLLLRGAAVVLFAPTLDCEAGRAWATLLDALRDRPRDPTGPVAAYGRWIKAIATGGRAWPALLLDRLFDAENAFSQAAASQAWADLSPGLVALARQDLRHLQAIAATSAETLRTWTVDLAPQAIELPIWQADDPREESGREESGRDESGRDESGRNESAGELAPQDHPPSQPEEESDRASDPDAQVPQAVASPAELKAQFSAAADWGEAIETLAAYYRRQGVGTLARGRAFRWFRGDLVAVPTPDPIALADLTGYDRPKQLLIQNTEFLLAGQRALNVLLYGARGSGKSSLVKALLSLGGDRGLRLVEVAKHELFALPEILDRLRSAPQKFILFVDDLSFEENDDEFKALKVALEGGLTARPTNVVVYATSNRRHLVREFFADRPPLDEADEVQAWDTLQEKLSFADRFGLTLTFEPSNQDTYLAIVRHLAERAGLSLAADELVARACQWALEHNGRSGRTARQFIDFLVAEQAIASPKSVSSSENSSPD